MERLIFICPVSGEEVDVGITSDLMSLLRMRRQRIFAECSACSQRHEWQVRDAFLAKAA
jgi:transcription elongation factor Elf1